jgi:hypothetical protein
MTLHAFLLECCCIVTSVPSYSSAELFLLAVFGTFDIDPSMWHTSEIVDSNLVRSWPVCYIRSNCRPIGLC